MRNSMLTNDEKAVLKELKEVLKELLSDSLLKCVLFGSKARGDCDNESDLDVAIVVRNLTRELKNRILDEVAEIEFEYFIPISTFIISEADFMHLRERERRIVIDIEREGISF